VGPAAVAANGFVVSDSRGFIVALGGPLVNDLGWGSRPPVHVSQIYADGRAVAHLIASLVRHIAEEGVYVRFRTDGCGPSPDRRNVVRVLATVVKVRPVYWGGRTAGYLATITGLDGAEVRHAPVRLEQ
jgi:hypothetical protein